QPDLPGRHREPAWDAVDGQRARPEVEPRWPSGTRARWARPGAIGRRWPGRRIRGHGRPRPDPADEVALGRELLVGRRDRDPGDPEIRGKRPDPGQPPAGQEAPLVDRGPDLVLDLTVERNRARAVELDRRGAGHDCG